MCHYITLTSLSDSSEDVEIPHFQLLFDPQINEDFDMKLVNWCSDITRLYWQRVYLLNFRIGYHTTVNYFTATHLLSIWDLIAWWSKPMPDKAACLNLIISESDMWKIPSITPAKTEFLFFQCYTLARHLWTRSIMFRSACPSHDRYRPFVRDARIINIGYYVLMLKIIRWWFQQNSNICIDELIALMGRSGLSYRLMRCTLYLFEQMLDRHIWWKWILHQIWLGAYGVWIIMWMKIPIGLYIKWQCRNPGVQEDDS
jgi:hypothetical protein